MEIIPIPALKHNHNYIWIIKAEQQIVIVDPGIATPVLDFIQVHDVQPIAILITHHHWDHVNGILDIQKEYSNIRVYTPKCEEVAGSTDPVSEGDCISLPSIGLELNILDVPGHTAGAIAYYNDELVFSGDTLFTGGCGRLFEGSAEQMYASLGKFQALPDTTAVYCGHEYTVANLKFAIQVEPNNELIPKRLSKEQSRSITVPAPMSLEKETNPFLRCDQPEVIAAAERYSGKSLTDPIAVWATLRQWKNNF